MAVRDTPPTRLAVTRHTRPVNVRQILDAYAKQRQAIAQTWTPLRQEVASINAALEPFRQQMVEASTAVAPVQEVGRILSRIVGSYRVDWSKLEQQNHQLINAIQRWIREAPKQRQAMLNSWERLAAFGWYVDSEMPWSAPAELARSLMGDNSQEIVDAIASYFRHRVTSIEEQLSVRYPHRREILRDAFDAHREGKYNLSVPVLLAQADGLWWDRFSRSFFSRQGRRVLDDEDVLELHGRIDTAFLEFFQESAPLWQSIRERDSKVIALNRHQVLHGEALEYGTEYNSLRAISFLGCLCWILEI